MDAATEASIEAYEVKPATARDVVMAAITAHETVKRAREEAEKRNTANNARKKRDDVARNKKVNEEKEKEVVEG